MPPGTAAADPAAETAGEGHPLDQHGMRRFDVKLWELCEGGTTVTLRVGTGAFTLS